MKEYAIYLRKSRADLEAEARGEGETLERHRTALRALAKARKLAVVREYAEIVTGDSIAVRPQMQALLEEVKRGVYAGVIVNDVDRLGRGDSVDQEIIKATFCAGNCIIVTPNRDIDPANPTDQDMLDFSMFFARFELRKISQRMNQGRIRSAQAGNYLSPRVPFGYRKKVDGKRITLEADPATAGIVQMCFRWYASGEAGFSMIATRLNAMGVKTCLNRQWSREAVRLMLANPIYIGEIVWGKTKTVMTIEDGRRVKKHVASTPTIVEGAHPALIDRATFDKAQRRREDTRSKVPLQIDKTLVNPLAGILYCSQCGKKMALKGNPKKGGVLCQTYGCPTIGTSYHVILKEVLSVLREWCVDYSDAPEPEPPAVSEEQEAIKRQIEAVEAQLKRAYELVEIGAYSAAEFVERRNALEKRLNALRTAATPNPSPRKGEAVKAAVPAIERVLDAFPYATTAQQQNELLKSVVEKIVYTKTEQGSKKVNPASLMTLDIYPRIGRMI